jgi:hypothetical protein
LFLYGIILHLSYNERYSSELVDRKYVTRDKRGMCYQVVLDGYGNSLFAPEVNEIDVMDVVEDGCAEAEARKRMFMEK